MFVFLVVLVVAVAAATGLITMAILQSRQAGPGPERPAATLTTQPLPPVPPSPAAGTPQPHPFPPHVPARHVGRHHEETVRAVPADWMPVTGEARIRALETTRVFPAPEIDPHRKGGGQ